MPVDARIPVKFKTPPVVEVVCGVSFSLAKPLKTAHIGSFWADVRNEFPNIDDAAPLPLIVEGLNQPPASANFQFFSVPPLRRAWMMATDGKHLIQLQDDRFVFNWKRVSDEDAYPSYQKVIAGFNRQLEKFIGFVKSAGLGDLLFTQLELAYINQVGPKNGMNEQEPWSFLADHMKDQSANRFLPAPEGFNWNTTYRLPDLAGRLHVVALNARNNATGQQIVRLDITARGLPKDTSTQGRQAWFDLAHEWITHGFADVTSPEIQKQAWGRTA